MLQFVDGHKCFFGIMSTARTFLVWQLILSCLPPLASSQGSTVRSLSVGGHLPARYIAKVAAFGNPLDGSDGNAVRRTYNLMVRGNSGY